MKEPHQEPWVDHGRVAEHIGMTEQALYQLRHLGKGPPAVRIGKRIRYRLSEVDAWMESRREGAAA